MTHECLPEIKSEFPLLDLKALGGFKAQCPALSVWTSLVVSWRRRTLECKNYFYFLLKLRKMIAKLPDLLPSSPFLLVTLPTRRAQKLETLLPKAAIKHGHLLLTSPDFLSRSWPKQTRLAALSDGRSLAPCSRAALKPILRT